MYFGVALKFGAQVHPDAMNKSGCEKRPWTRNGKSSRQFEHGIWKVKIKKEVIKEAQKNNNCHTDGHVSPQKNAELEPKLQKYKGRVVLRGDIVRDDSGAYAVFTEQGSSASQMTAAKVMDITETEKGDRERDKTIEKRREDKILSLFHFCIFEFFLSFFCFLLVQVFDYRYRFPVVRN